METPEPAPRFMLLPADSCPAHCVYCFGPHLAGNSGRIMPQETFAAAIEWIDALTPSASPIEITFHGGEPLNAGLEWYRRGMAILHQRFGDRLKLGIQTNLWYFNQEWCDLFKTHHVAMGTSLDGPEAIHDAQRGAGSFQRTMAGINLARQNGLAVGIICTFTRQSALQYRQVFDFFADRGLSFAVHAAIQPPATTQERDFALAPVDYARLMLNLLDLYLGQPSAVLIPTFDAMARSIAAGSGGLCIFTDCPGKYLAVSPAGGFFTCSRFASLPDWQMGTVFTQPGWDILQTSPAWQRLGARQEAVQRVCGDCDYYALCKGGCPYQAILCGDGEPAGNPRDPYCPAYRDLFARITNLALQEMFSAENLQAIIENDPRNESILPHDPAQRKLLQIMRQERDRIPPDRLNPPINAG